MQPNLCALTHIDPNDKIRRLDWERTARFINRTVIAFGWMVPEGATGPFSALLNAMCPNIPDHVGCDNPDGWTMPRLRAAVLHLKAAFPEMPGVLAWAGDRGGCRDAARTFVCDEWKSIRSNKRLDRSTKRSIVRSIV